MEYINDYTLINSACIFILYGIRMIFRYNSSRGCYIDKNFKLINYIAFWFQFWDIYRTQIVIDAIGALYII